MKSSESLAENDRAATTSPLGPVIDHLKLPSFSSESNTSVPALPSVKVYSPRPPAPATLPLTTAPSVSAAVVSTTGCTLTLYGTAAPPPSRRPSISSV